MCKSQSKVTLVFTLHKQLILALTNEADQLSSER
jgi:hypothetical protein